MEAAAALIKKANVTVASIFNTDGFFADWIEQDFYFIELNTVLSMGVRLRQTGALLVSQEPETMEKIRRAIFPPGSDFLSLIPGGYARVEISSVKKMEMLVSHKLFIAFDNRFVKNESDYATSFPIEMINKETADELIGNLTVLDCS